MASEHTAEYKYVKQRGDKWVIVQKGTGKVLSEHDSEEKAKSAFRAMEMNMHGGSAEVTLEGDKFYVAVEGKVVEAGFFREGDACEKCEHGACEGDCSGCGTCEDEKSASTVGARVEADGRLGTVVATLDTIYGDSVAVRMDGDGEIETYFPEDLKTSSEDPIEYESATAEVLADHEKHAEMPAETLEEVRSKLASAKALRLRARSLVTDEKIGFADRVKLDAVISAVAVDEYDLAEDEATLAVANGDGALANRPRVEQRYQLEGASGGGAIAREDGSWIGLVDDDFTEEEERIAAEATVKEAAAEEEADDGAIADEELDAISDEHLLFSQYATASD
jgi:hypothetical protein